MYSGTVLHAKSGRIMGVHQKIDRVSRRHLKPYIANQATFPSIKEILHFEGKNGPDGLKTKSPGVDEPWHFIDPHSPIDSGLLQDIVNHQINLSVALSEENAERAAFEAAWLAHAITDGLTPAHHIEYDAMIAELRGGEHHMTRDSKTKKAIMPGKNSTEIIKNNWKYWGAGGLMNKHLQFEFGVASAVSTMKFQGMSFEPADIDAEHEDFIAVFLDALHTVDELYMYDEFMRNGWTRKLGSQCRTILVPEIIRTVMGAWLIAARNA